MDLCANTQSLNRYMDKQESNERLREQFENSIEDEISEIEEIVESIKRKAKDYEGLDFTEEAKDRIRDVI